MPYFEMDISPSDYLDCCHKSEIDELIKQLKIKGHLSDDTKKFTLNEREHYDASIKISKSYHKLSNEDCDIIKKISYKL